MSLSALRRALGLPAEHVVTTPIAPVDGTSPVMAVVPREAAAYVR